MAIVKNIWGNASEASTSDFSITPSVTPTEGRVMVAFIGKDGSAAITPPSGWIEVYDLTDTGTTMRFGVYWKVVTASEPSLYTWSSAGEHWGGAIYELQSADRSTVVDTSVTAEGDSTAPTSATITPSVANTLVFSAFGHNNNAAATVNVGLSNPFVELAIGAGVVGAAGGSELRADTSATGAYAHTLSSAQEWIAVTVAILPGVTTLSVPTAAGESTTTLSGTVITDGEDGTLYKYVDSDVTPPSKADLKVGTGAVAFGSQAVTATGEQTITGMGPLAPSTNYYVHYLHSDANGDSDIVTTAVVATLTSAITFNVAGAISLSSLEYAIFDGYDVASSALLLQGSDGATDGSGNMTINLDAVAVDAGDKVSIVITDYTTAPTAGSKAAVCYATVTVS